MKTRILAAALLTAVAMDAGADDSAWRMRVGVHNVDPKSDNGTLAGMRATVDSAAGLTFNVDYFFTPHLAIDVLAALPFEHDIQLNGGAAGSTRQLPPTVSLQYHLQPQAKIAPFVGVGLNYTMFFNEESSLGDLRLDDSFGLALQAGVDLAFDRNWSAGIDARWIDIDTKVSLNGSNIGTAHLDPLVYGLTLIRRF